jgi:hypothetical protein
MAETKTGRFTTPEDTTELETRALLAINEAQSLELLMLEWSEILREFRAADIPMPLAIEARFRERQRALSRGRHWWTR